MVTANLARHSRVLVENGFRNGHPDPIVDGVHPGNVVLAGEQRFEVKSTRKPSGAVDTHGARNQWMCVFVHRIDNATEPPADRAAMRFTEIHLAPVTADDFRRNPRGNSAPGPLRRAAFRSSGGGGGMRGQHVAEGSGVRNPPQSAGSPSAQIVLDPAVERVASVCRGRS